MKKICILLLSFASAGTLYLIDFNKKIEQLHQENPELKKLLKNQNQGK